MYLTGNEPDGSSQPIQSQHKHGPKEGAMPSSLPQTAQKIHLSYICCGPEELHCPGKTCLWTQALDPPITKGVQGMVPVSPVASCTRPRVALNVDLMKESCMWATAALILQIQQEFPNPAVCPVL